MFWKSVKSSIRLKLVFWGLLICSAILTISGSIILVATHEYLSSHSYSMLRGILNDLSEEYVTYGGLSDEFRHCVEEDVQERNPDLMEISIYDQEGRLVYEIGKIVGRDEGHRIKERSQHLGSGLKIVVRRDIESDYDFLWFLGWVIIIAGVITDMALGFSLYFIGSRILRLNDIVEEKDRAYDELRKLTDDIAHDLRTPLTRLNLAAENSYTNNLPADALAVTVARDTGAMVEMINTMLEISQTDFKVDRTPREELDMNKIVGELAELYEAVSEDEGLKFEVALPEAPIALSAHRAKIQQMIGNLLDNAFKFTPNGGKVKISLSEDNGKVRIEVIDTGAGIAAKDIDHIFDRFYRADMSRSLPGNGLGLALVKAIVTSYGGSVGCTSEVGRGTRFIVKIPQHSREI